MLGVMYVVLVWDVGGVLVGVWDVDFDMGKLLWFLKEWVFD